MWRWLMVCTAALGGCAGFPSSERTSLAPGPRTEPEAQAAPEVVVRIEGGVNEPLEVLPSSELQQSLQVPEGFTVGVFAEALGNPRMLTVAPDGSIYVTRRAQGDVVLLRDENGDGRSDVQTIVMRRPGMHGFALHGGEAFFVTVKDVYRADVRQDGTLGEPERIIDDLPDGGQHPNRTIVVGPDDRLYISIGSTCNACDETNPESATIVRAGLDGGQRAILASGLRNTIGFGFHPETGELWGMDNGADWQGDDAPGEELNRIEAGKRYGWPYVFGADLINPQDEPPNGVTSEEWAAMSETPVLEHTAHAAPMQLAFYDGAAFPAEYRGDAFVAMRGSWNRTPPSGYEVVRVDFEGGEPTRIEPFLTGFLVDGGAAQFGRPTGVAVAADGALLVADDTNGVIYRVAPAGPAPTPAASPAEPPLAPALEPAPRNDVLASQRPETAAPDALAVEAEAFDGRVEDKHADYAEGVSPAVSWSAGPPRTQSYAILLEDPDASEPKPFVHWTAYNIPREMRALPEALPTDVRLPVPFAIEQGANSRGSTGYFGPRPPEGRAHRYHLQVFALDTMLDIEPGADRETLLAAMDGHVLAKGEAVGEYAKP